MTSPRLRELFGLVPVSLLVTAGFTAVFVTRSDEVQTVTLTYGAFFLGCCVVAHLFIRARLPDADPYLFPLAALLAAFGLVMIYRLNEGQAGQQAVWFLLSLGLFVLTILFLRDYRTLERYRYTIAAAAIVLLLLPRLPLIGAPVNGAYLGVDLGPVEFQPAEFAKLAIIVFLASYLADNREVLLGGRSAPAPLRRSLPLLAACAGLGALLHLVAGWSIVAAALAAAFVATLAALVRERPSMKHVGPLLLVWGLAMLMLVFIRDLGSSLMFFGAFLILLYVATSRLSFVAFGGVIFAAGAAFIGSRISHVSDRLEIWAPFSADPVRPDSAEGYQVAQSLFAQADGGLFGQGFGQALVFPPGGGRSIIPAAETDLIYALIADEAGLFGACAVLLISLLFAARGFKTALIARDDFAKLLATGLAAVFALQVFVIVGGVTRVIPLTGVTLPFISYGGSSLLANLILLALLLIVSDHARRDLAGRGGVV